ncbi:expressed unknown protein [Seminavis robusta]|uniref:Uncharacterized protein n=1 Tax=Seminavis robusta TaxID=568900 RepID=A0A9N8DRR1_9STRA|nr:expressed unknown protein [Seminavis robusta]|eukprot:Sro235_g094650.1 n/a (299) ;mRNA; f:13759-14655
MNMELDDPSAKKAMFAGTSKEAAFEDEFAEGYIAPSHFVEGEDLPVAAAVSTTKGKQEDNAVLLQIVAPATMGAGFSLYVECEGSKYLVKVPKGGVEEGQTFTAHGRPGQTAITGGWRDGLFECCHPMEGEFSCLAWCFTPCAFALLMDSLRMDCFCRRDSGIPRHAVFYFMCALGIVNTVLYIATNQQAFDAAYTSPYATRTQAPQPADPVLSLTFVALVWYTIFVFVAVRYFARRKYGIPGNLCLDFLATKFCACCSALQIYRHMKSSGHEPDLFRAETKATLAPQAALASKASLV